MYCIQMGTASTFGGLLGGGGSAAGGAAIRAAGFLYGLVCDRTPPAPQGPPFEGGQCPGVLYGIGVLANVRYYDLILGVERVFEPTGYNLQAVGPITFIGWERVGEHGLRMVAKGATGEFERIAIPDDPRFVDQVYSVVSIELSAPGDDVNRCGSLPPSYPPYIPGDNTSNDNVTYTNNEGDDITMPFSVTWGFHFEDTNGDINVPITVNFTANPEFNFNGNIRLPDFVLRPNFGNPALPGSPSSPASDDYVVDDDPDEYSNPISPNIPDPSGDDERPETRRILRGVHIVTTGSDPDIGRVLQNFNPDIMIPNLGYVNFLIKIGDRQGWTPDYPVKNRNTFIRCDWEGGALLARATPRPGVVWSVSNVYTRQSFNPKYPPEPG